MDIGKDKKNICCWQDCTNLVDQNYNLYVFLISFVSLQRCVVITGCS